MTAKRFNRVGGYVYDGDKCISHFEDVAHRDDIVKLLNELHEENKQLRNDCSILVQSNQDYRKENEQLKGILLDMLETSMETKALREAYCDGLLRIFDKANSLNQAREMIKGHLK